jgi:DNA-binding beta-propeller fold protein YncE
MGFDFLANKVIGAQGYGPERPTSVEFSPDGKYLYVVDFGVMETMEGQVMPTTESGALWRIKKGNGSTFSAEKTVPNPQNAAPADGGNRLGIIILWVALRIFAHKRLK